MNIREINNKNFNINIIINNKSVTRINEYLEDFEKKLKGLLKNLKSYNPRVWFSKHYGPENSGKRLKKFLKEIFPSLIDSKYAKFAI